MIYNILLNVFDLLLKVNQILLISIQNVLIKYIVEIICSKSRVPPKDVPSTSVGQDSILAVSPFRKIW